MSNAGRFSDPRLEELADQVRLLTARVDRLTDELKQLAGHPVAQLSLDAKGTGVEAAATDDQMLDQSESPAASHQITAPTLLTNVAIVCFLLVIALILRTVVDSGIVNQLVGSVLGMGYAGFLMAYGGFLYVRGRPRATMVSVSGMLLLLSIIFETHTLFEIVPTPVTYSLLGIILIPATVWGVRYGATAACYVGLLGTSICGIAIEFPDPMYIWLSALLLLANGCALLYLGGAGSRLLMSLQFVVTMFFWLIWVTKIRAALSASTVELDALHLPWAIPVLAAFAITYLAAAVRLMLRDSGSLSPFELSMPTFNVLWAYIVAQGIVSPWTDRSDWVGIGGVIVAAGHLLLCVWFTRRDTDRDLTSTSFAVAGVVLLLVALPACTPTPYWAVAVWSLVALCLAVAAGVWKIKAIRFVSYVLQVIAVIAAAQWGLMASAIPFPVLRTSILVLAAGFTCAHFCWCRLWRPLSPTPLFRSVSILTFLACIAYAFGAARIVLYAVLTETLNDVAHIFLAGQSLILNGMAVVLMLVALRRKNLEILLTSTVVAGAAAVKVFGYDFLNTADLPRVLSVASSGITAAFGSYVWSEWQRHRESPRPKPRDGTT